MPAAFTPIIRPPSLLPEPKQIQESVRRLRSLRTKWFGPQTSPITAKKCVTVAPGRHLVHPSGTRWLLSIAHVVEFTASVQVFDLMTGSMIGELPLLNPTMFARLLSAQKYGYNRILLAYAQESYDGDGP